MRLQDVRNIHYYRPRYYSYGGTLAVRCLVLIRHYVLDGRSSVDILILD